MPVGALATIGNGTVRLRAVVASLDGSRWVEGAREGAAAAGHEVGTALGEELLARGGAEILDQIRGATGDRG